MTGVGGGKHECPVSDLERVEDGPNVVRNRSVGGAGPRSALGRTIYRWCGAGVLPYRELKTGGSRRFLREDLDKLLKPGKPQG
jgi:hypothetical protein